MTRKIEQLIEKVKNIIDNQETVGVCANNQHTKLIFDVMEMTEEAFPELTWEKRSIIEDDIMRQLNLI